MQTVPVKEWEKSAVDCLDIVADASKIIKNKKLVESGGYRRVKCVIDKESFHAIQDGK